MFIPLLILSLILPSYPAVAAAAPGVELSAGPGAGQRAILRVQRSESDFELLRCLTTGLTPEEVDQSICQSAGSISLAKIDGAIEAFGAGRPLTAEDKGEIIKFSLIGLAGMGALGIITVGGSALFGARGRGLVAVGFAFALGAVVVAGVGGFGQYQAVYQQRERARKALAYARNLLTAKIPDGQEFVQPIPEELWSLFAPSSFGGAIHRE